jgi:hypothetical protein
MELGVAVDESSLLAEAKEFMRFLARYAARPGVRILPGQTLLYGFSVTRFHDAGEGRLDLWESDFDPERFVPGVTRTLATWRDQHRACGEAGAEFAPPRPDALAAVSDGVLEGDPVEGVRYPSSAPMSGWFLTTERYTGDVATMRCEHLYHVARARPDLVAYLALPGGFRFFAGPDGGVWFDPAVAESPPV